METITGPPSKHTADMPSVFHIVELSTPNVKPGAHMVKGYKRGRNVTWADAVRHFGTEDRIRELARQAGFSTGAASNWKDPARQGIPVRAYESLVAHAEKADPGPAVDNRSQTVYTEDQLYTDTVRAVTQITTGERWDLIFRLQSLLEHLVQWNNERVEREQPVATPRDTATSQLEAVIDRLREVEERTGGAGEVWQNLVRDLQTLLSQGLGDTKDSGHGNHDREGRKR
jgi:hypothetical protein